MLGEGGGSESRFFLKTFDEPPITMKIINLIPTTDEVQTFVIANKELPCYQLLKIVVLTSTPEVLSTTTTPT